MKYNTVVLKKYNQLATETPFGNGSGNRNYTLSYDSNTNLHTIEAIASQTGARVLCTKSIQAQQNHKYAIILNFLVNSFSKKTGVHIWLYLDGVGYTVSYDYSAVLQWNYQDSNILMMLDLITNAPDSFTAGQKAVFYLNIVDLTEIYGTGNEPTTVDQFLADYPKFNEYVPYKENGYFEKKYSSLTLRKSKNLFDISKVISYAQYLINNADGSITVNTIGAQGASSPNKLKDFCPNLRVGDTVTLSANSTVSTANDRIIYLTKSSRVFGFGISYTITQDDLDSTVYFYSDRTLRVPATISNIMIELGSTATDYEPYGWIEKEYNALTLKKYNQLVAKSKLPVNQTVNGVIFTNNNDGTVSTSGTATGWVEVSCGLIDTIVIGNKYLGIGSNIGGRTETYCINFSNGVRGFIDTGSGIVFTAQDNERITPYIRFLQGISANNLVFKPQLVDLTKMYGAGNEPTTVQKFLEDNPQYNNYVPYSEGGWM